MSQPGFELHGNWSKATQQWRWLLPLIECHTGVGRSWIESPTASPYPALEHYYRLIKTEIKKVRKLTKVKLYIVEYFFINNKDQHLEFNTCFSQWYYDLTISNVISFLMKQIYFINLFWAVVGTKQNALLKIINVII